MAKDIWNKAFWKGAGERAIKTFAASMAALLSANTTGILDVDWVQMLSVSGLATLVSFLIAVGNSEFTAGKPDTAIVYISESELK